MQTLSDYAIGRIHADDHDQSGAHWASMRPVDEYLAGWLESFAAVLRLSRGEATGDDYDRLELEGSAEPEEDCSESAWRWASEAFLDVATATWDDNRSFRPLCRVELVTGTGGPHTELVGQYDRQGRCERVEAHQYWSGHREAWTDDSRALEVFEDFRAAFVYAPGE